MKNIFSELEKWSLATEYIHGESLRSLADKYECDRNVIKRAVCECGVELRTKEQSCIRRQVDETYFDNIDTEKKAYFLGLIYADGCLKVRRGIPVSLSVSLQDYDVYLLQEFKKDIKSEHKIGRYLSSSSWCNYLTISNRSVVNSLIKIGCTPRKTFTCDIPVEYIPNKMIHHFIRGYFDGDGHIGNYLRAYRWKNKDKLTHSVRTQVNFCASQPFAMSIQSILKLSNIFTSITNDHSIKRVRISDNSIMEFAKFIYTDSTIWMKRKRIKFEEVGAI